MVISSGQWIGNRIREVPYNVRITFCVAVVCGLLTHLFMLTNKLPNHDDIMQIFDKMERASSGRWFLEIPAAISSRYSMPWLNGILTIFYISLASAFCVASLEIRKVFNCILLAGTMISFPVVGCTLTYMNSADGYAFALLLAMVAVYLARKFSWGFIPAGICIVLSMGIYQAYFGLAAGMLVVVLILDLIREDSFFSVKKFIRKAFRFFSSLVIGVVGYLLVVKLVDVPLVSYHRIDTMGQIPLSAVPSAVIQAYRSFFSFFFKNSFCYQFSFMKILFALSAVAIILIVISLIVRKRVSYHKIITLLLLVTILPLATNIIYVMCWNTSVHLLMVYGLVSIFAWIIGLLDIFESEEQNRKNGNRVFQLAQSLSCWVLTITLVVSIYNNIYVTNRSYFKLHMVYEQGYAYTNRLIGRIEGMESYNKGCEVLFIGFPDTKTEFSYELQDQDLSKMLGVIDSIPNTYTYDLFSQIYMGFDASIQLIRHAEEIDDLVMKELLTTMPDYPSAGSIIANENQIIVKFSDVE